MQDRCNTRNLHQKARPCTLVLWYGKQYWHCRTIRQQPVDPSFVHMFSCPSLGLDCFLLACSHECFLYIVSSGSIAYKNPRNEHKKTLKARAIKEITRFPSRELALGCSLLLCSGRQQTKPSPISFSAPVSNGAVLYYFSLA